MIIADMPPPDLSTLYNDSVDEPSKIECIQQDKSFYSEPEYKKISIQNPEQLKIMGNPVIEKDEQGNFVVGFLFPNESFSFDNKVFVKIKNPPSFFSRDDKMLNTRWGISCYANSDSFMERELSRRFSMLSNKAFLNELSDNEKNNWRNIINDIDYHQFQIDNASPIYMEGRVESKKANKVTLERNSDGKRIYITGEKAIASCLFLEKNDYVWMTVKYNLRNEIDYIEKCGLMDSPPKYNPNWLNDIPVREI